jgi:hypothetical protein
MPERIITLYCLCDELCKALDIRDDVQAQMTTAEVMLTALVAAWLFKGNMEMSRVFLKSNGYVPKMLGTSRLNRRVHRISDSVWRTVLLILSQAHQALTDETAAFRSRNEFIVDSMPVPACANVRMNRCKLYQDATFHGYIASKQQYFHGLRVHLLTTASGIPVEFVLAPGSQADIRVFKTFELALDPGAVIYADKAYTDYKFELLLKDALDVQLQPLRKKNSLLNFQTPGWLTYICAKTRKQIESTFARIADLMPRRIHAVTSRGFELKVALFVIAFAACA